MVAFLVVLLITSLIRICDAKVANQYLIAFSSAIVCSQLFHLFLGLVWRFSSPGRLVSGDRLGRSRPPSDQTEAEWKANVIDVAGYQLHGGRFMSAYLYIEIAVFTGFFIFVLVFCTWLCCFRRDKEL